MRITLITKRSKGGCWAYCNFNNDVLIECGKTAEDVVGKVKELLHQYHGIDKDEVEFIIETAGITKAKNMIKRLKKETGPAALTVTFDTNYFS